MRARILFLIVAAFGTLAAACGGLGGQPPERPPVVQASDGNSYYLVEHGAYKAFYDPFGRLDHVDYDSNGDGRVDHVARHQGSKRPHRVEIDADFDGRWDRWEDFDPEGQLIRFSVLAADGRARMWTVVGAKEEPLRYEYDEDADGRMERAEIVSGGRVSRIEIDSDRDGRYDRWQDWGAGRLRSESLDIDGDGHADRRLVFSPAGSVERVERLAP